MPQKNDAADAEAICEAVTRPSMRFGAIKSPEQQGVTSLHQVRVTLMRQRIQLSNAIRGHMTEHGVVAPVGREGLGGLIAAAANDERLPADLRAAVAMLATQLSLVNEQVLDLDRRIRSSARRPRSAVGLWRFQASALWPRARSLRPSPIHGS